MISPQEGYSGNRHAGRDWREHGWVVGHSEQTQAEGSGCSFEGGQRCESLTQCPGGGLGACSGASDVVLKCRIPVRLFRKTRDAKAFDMRLLF